MERPPSTSTAHARDTTLERLVDELTGAIEDTVRLTTGSANALEWHVHLDYLRAMQRLARETLAAPAAR